MNSTIIIITVFLLIIGYSLFSHNPVDNTPVITNSSLANVCFVKNNLCFSCEVPDDNPSRAKGLMGRTELNINSGMLFVFERDAKHGFWMKNTLIPLDIIWIDSNYSVVDIVYAKPCIEKNCPTFSPKINAKYVLEINGGLTDIENISVGDKVTLSL